MLIILESTLAYNTLGYIAEQCVVASRLHLL
jgi:hypothetical protein